MFALEIRRRRERGGEPACEEEKGEKKLGNLGYPFNLLIFIGIIHTLPIVVRVRKSLPITCPVSLGKGRGMGMGHPSAS